MGRGFRCRAGCACSLQCCAARPEESKLKLGGEEQIDHASLSMIPPLLRCHIDPSCDDGTDGKSVSQDSAGESNFFFSSPIASSRGFLATTS